MTHILFQNFLDSTEEFKACEMYWEQLVYGIAQSLGQGGEWLRWIPKTYANGTTPLELELDGNPIFDGRSESLDRAFRIIQHRAASNELEISAWLKSYEAEYTDLPRDELVINLTLSQESAQLAQALLYKWMMPTTTIDEMQSFIDESITYEP